MKLSQIRSFVAVAKYGKFSSAAVELDLTQPTVSHAIATLEKDLGVQLLFRGQKGVKSYPRRGKRFSTLPANIARD